MSTVLVPRSPPHPSPALPPTRCTPSAPANPSAPHSPTSTAPSTNRRRSLCPAAPSTQKTRHIQRCPHVLALRLLRSSRIHSHKHYRPSPQRRGLQPSVLAGKVQHHHPPSHLLPIEIAPNPHRRPKSPVPANPSGGTVEVCAPFGHTAYRGRRLILPLQSPAPVHRHHHRKGGRVASLTPTPANCPSTYSAARDTPRIAGHPRSQRGQMLPQQPVALQKPPTGPMAKTNKKAIISATIASQYRPQAFHLANKPTDAASFGTGWRDRP